MKNLLSFFLFFIPSFVFSQYQWDFGGGIGTANYLGEIGGSDKTARGFVADMQMSQSRWGANAFARRKIVEGLSASAGIYYGRIQGADSLCTYSPRRGRNLSFQNDIIELSARGEYAFYTSYDVGRTGRYILDFRTYIFAGVGGFYHNPKAKNIDGKWVALQPLMTEGPGNKYSQFQVCFPMGVGFYYTYKKMHRIGWEMGWRYTLTDYLDDASTVTPDKDQISEEAWAMSVRTNEITNRTTDIPTPADYTLPGSIRGNPNNKDSYIFSNVTYSYVLRGKYKNRKFRPTKLGIGGLGDIKRRKKRKTRAKF